MVEGHILIVDDEPRVAAFLGEALADANPACQVMTSRSAEKAQETMRRSRVDLLVTDVRMPGMSGLELLQWTRETTPETRTILITAYANDAIREQARAMGVTKILNKPFGISEICRAVEEVLGEATSGKATPTILSAEAHELIADHLETCRTGLEAATVLLADRHGNQLATSGDVRDLDVSALLTVLSSSFATNQELAHRFGNGDSADLNYHQGSDYEFYSATMGKEGFVTVVYDRRVLPSDIGIVWLHLRRTVDRIRTVIEGESRHSEILVKPGLAPFVVELEDVDACTGRGPD